MQPPTSKTPERDAALLEEFNHRHAAGERSTFIHQTMADRLGVTASRVRHILSDQRKRMVLETPETVETTETSETLPMDAVPDGFSVQRLTTLVDANGETITQSLQTKPSALKTTAIQDSVPDGYRIKGISTYLNQRGQVTGQWIKVDQKQQEWLSIVNGVLESIPKLVTPLPPVRKASLYTNDLLALYPIVDWHLGMYATLLDAERNWRLADAICMFKRSIDYLIARTPKTASAVIAQIGDFTHVDNQTNATPNSGARLDVDGRYVEIAIAAFDLAVYVISSVARHHRNVSVVWLGGNHDPNTALVMQTALATMYRNDARIQVPVTGRHTHCIRHGQVALGFTHGDTIKPKDLVLNMAVDYPAIWAETTYHVWHTGHRHHKSVEEFPGGIVECHESPAPRDSWHELMGYRSQHGLCSVIYDPIGEYSRNTVQIRLPAPDGRESKTAPAMANAA